MVLLDYLDGGSIGNLRIFRDNYTSAPVGNACHPKRKVGLRLFAIFKDEEVLSFGGVHGRES